ncbi:MAG: RNA polymerase sigma factor [Chloroflexota bacterium]|jgi:RNA polymerase sigma factor (sigma-70 family)|nr:RNA polymerase sigma factor [Chloroflexota bacterium]
MGSPRSTRSGTPDTPEGFARWVEPEVAAMGRLAARLGPIGDQDDIVQESLVRAWNKRHQYDPDRGSASAWLLAITADQARHAARRRRPLLQRFDVAARSASPEERVDIERAMARLPRRQRLAIDCYYFAGISVRDTAAVMGCSEGTVKSTLSDARRRLRELLEVR